MNRIITILILMLLSIQLIGQKQDSLKIEHLNIRLDSIKKEGVELNEKVIFLSTQNSELSAILKSNEISISELKSKVNLYQTALETDDVIFGGISTYFTVVAILLSIVVIAIPVINYFLVLKPNQEALNKVENLEAEVIGKIEENFESYLNNLERTKSKRVIELLKDRGNLSKVVDYFFLRNSEGLEDEDIEIVIKFLKENDDIEEVDKITLNSIIQDSDSLLVEKYYKSLFEKENKKNLTYAIDYLIKNNFPSHINFVETIIKGNDDGHKLLIDFFSHIQNRFIGYMNDKKAPEKVENGKEYINLLFNSNKILDGIKETEVPKDSTGSPLININTISRNKFLRETKYYQIYLKSIDRK